MQSVFTPTELTLQGSFFNHPGESHPRVAMIITDPKDEVNWAGDLLVSNPNWKWSIISACGNDDSERNPPFPSVFGQLKAMGAIVDLNVGPKKQPLLASELDRTMKPHLTLHSWDLIVTHGLIAERVSHRRSREVCDSVVRLWEGGRISSREVWMFDSDDENGRRLPHAQKDASIVGEIEYSIREFPPRLITETYRIPPRSWKVRAAPCPEGFKTFKTPKSARKYIDDSSHY